MIPDVPQVGCTIPWRLGHVRVMAVVDGWLMLRRPHCVPFCISVKDWQKEFGVPPELRLGGAVEMSEPVVAP